MVNYPPGVRRELGPPRGALWLPSPPLAPLSPPLSPQELAPPLPNARSALTNPAGKGHKKISMKSQNLP